MAQSEFAFIDRIPSDVLITIFQIVIYDDRHTIYRYRHSSSKWRKPVKCFSRYPQQFAFVCSQWKHIVYSSPLLWSDFYVVFTPDELQMLTGIAKKWLHRSRPCPINLSIDMLPLGRTFPKTLKSVLIPFLGRIKSLRLVALKQHLIPLRDIHLGQMMPMLETFDLDVKGNLQRDFSLSFCGAGAPSFYNSRLKIRRGIAMSSILTELSIKRITSLELDGRDIPTHQVHELLSICEYLVSCVIRISFDPLDSVDYYTGNSSSVITLARLRRLELTCSDDECNFLNAFSLPSLKSLKLCSSTTKRSPSEIVTTFLGKLLKLQLRSDFPLEHLYIEDAVNADGYGEVYCSKSQMDEFFKFLQYTPTLVTIQICLYIADGPPQRIGEDIFKRLTWSKEKHRDSLLLPALSLINFKETLHGWMALYIREHDVVQSAIEMIKSRLFTDSPTCYGDSHSNLHCETGLKAVKLVIPDLKVFERERVSVAHYQLNSSSGTILEVRSYNQSLNDHLY